MMKILSCLVVEHQPHLVLVAIGICALGSLASCQILTHAGRMRRRRRKTMVALAGTTLACTIWSTHFTAMLAYSYDVGQGLDVVLTLASFLTAVVLGIGTSAIVIRPGPHLPMTLAGGAGLTATISTMHYIGMWSYSESALILWDHSYVIASVVAGFVVAAAAIALQRSRRGRLPQAAPLVLALSVAVIHFTGMTGVTLAPIASDDSAWSFTGDDLGYVVVVLSGLVVAVAFAVVAMDRRLLRERARRADMLARHNAELVVARNAAERAAEMRSSFLSLMSHELRTPLHGVIGTADMLSETGLTAEQSDHVTSIRTSGQSLLGIIDSILELAQLESGGVEIAEVTVDLRAELEALVGAHEPAARRRGLRLYLRYPAGAARFVRSDPGRIRSIVGNLLDNALKFTERGHVLVEVAETTDGIAVSVADTGIGIPEDRIDEVFAAFWQAEKGIARRFGGTGLGLTAGRLLARRLGGDITVDSRPGEGATFTLNLPVERLPATLPERGAGTIAVIADDELDRAILVEQSRALAGDVVTARSPEDLGALRRQGVTAVILCADAVPDAPVAGLPTLVVVPQPCPDPAEPAEGITVLTRPVRFDRLADWAAAPKEDGSEPLSGHGRRLLVTDDSHLNRRILVRLANAAGYETVEAANGAEAVDRCAADPFDAVLMDISMPVMDGYDATRLIRSGEAERGADRMPILAVTAHMDSAEHDKARQAGMDAVLRKPFSRDVILDALDRHIRALPGADRDEGPDGKARASA